MIREDGRHGHATKHGSHVNGNALEDDGKELSKGWINYILVGLPGL